MKEHIFRKIYGLAAVLLLTLPLRAQQAYVPAPENLEAREAFQNDRFGVFLHWGLYSMLAQGEWFMNAFDIDAQEYAKLASGFCPSRFDAASWVSAIKASGAGYLCITSRHHDGFSMFGTEASDYNIVDATPFGRDIMQELSDECHRQGLALHIYYSHLDWSREDYPQGRTGHGTGRDASKADWPHYYAFMNVQLRELITKYDPRAIWFDGIWDHDEDPDFDWQLEEQYAMMHTLKPALLIGNNHHQTPYSGEDFQMFERDLPGENTAGLSGQQISPLPLETCNTMNGMWGYKIRDQDYKSGEELIRHIVEAAGRGANLLLNMGPQPNGELPALGLDRLRQIGAWMQVNGETIRGTRAGDIPPHPWGVTTRKGNKLYVHILKLQEKGLFLPLEAKVRKAVDFPDGRPVRFRQDREGVVLYLDEVPSAVDHIIELELK